MFSNNSSIRVGTSLRSGTLQYLHVSEYGKLCAKYPDKAREVRTGALNTIQSGQVVFIESTAEGQEGHFFELSEAARAKERRGVPLTPLDFKFHFFPWWKSPDYELDPEGVEFTDASDNYFTKLASEHGIHLSDRQKAWYVKKAETQQEDMQRGISLNARRGFRSFGRGRLLRRRDSQGRAAGAHRTLPCYRRPSGQHRLGHRRRRLHGDLVFPDHRRPVPHRRLFSEQRRGNALLSRRNGAHGA